ncbi:MAG: phage antirepressor [Negativibacillus sp.]
MTDLQIFNSPEFGAIRTIEKDGEPWFVGKDVAIALGYNNPRDAFKKHIDEEDKGVAKCDTLGGTQETTIINESGLYSLVLSSKLPGAKQFKRWITSEVIPSIRKHGAYMTPDKLEEVLLKPDTLIQLAQNLKAEQEKRKALEAQIESQKPAVLFTGAVETSKTSILIGELAKMLKQNGVNIGQNRLFEWLRQHGYLIKRNGTDYNMPTQRSMDMGLFEIKETTINNPDGSIKINKTSKVTGKGQVYFINLFLNKEEL